MSSDRELGSLDELSGLFAQERIECEQELASMDPAALANQAMARAGLASPSGSDALDLDLQELFSVERAQAMQEAQAAMLPVAPGLASGGLGAPTLLSRVPLAAKWGGGLASAAGLAVVGAAVMQGSSPRSWVEDQLDAAPVQMVQPPLIEPQESNFAPSEDASRVPRLVPNLPKAVTLGGKKPGLKKLSLDDRLRRLEAQAQKAWKAKDRQLAREKFEQIISLAPQSSFAQWAWGDLFLLAKQDGEREARRALWTQYLAAHPKGRFADAAFAGLCSSAGQASKSCWQSYLKAFPRGAFVNKAKRGSGE